LATTPEDENEDSDTHELEDELAGSKVQRLLVYSHKDKPKDFVGFNRSMQGRTSIHRPRQSEEFKESNLAVKVADTAESFDAYRRDLIRQHGRSPTKIRTRLPLTQVTPEVLGAGDDMNTGGDGRVTNTQKESKMSTGTSERVAAPTCMSFSRRLQALHMINALEGRSNADVAATATDYVSSDSEGGGGGFTLADIPDTESVNELSSRFNRTSGLGSGISPTILRCVGCVDRYATHFLNYATQFVSCKCVRCSTAAEAAAVAATAQSPVRRTLEHIRTSAHKTPACIDESNGSLEAGSSPSRGTNARREREELEDEYVNLLRNAVLGGDEGAQRFGSHRGTQSTLGVSIYHTDGYTPGGKRFFSRDSLQEV
jgi:hypothetical protein